jgi:hypothetical protein
MLPSVMPRPLFERLFLFSAFLRTFGFLQLLRLALSDIP